MTILHPAVPPAPPNGGAAAVTDEPVKCPDCGRTVAWMATRPYRILCKHCRRNVERMD